MKKIAIYPGSFDPITFGHIDIINRSIQIFDKVIIAITQNFKKTPFLEIETRMKTANLIFANCDNIEVISFDNLLVDFTKQQNASVILRGLRAVSDFEYEFALAGMNKQLNPKIETMFIPSNEKYANISSSLVREIFTLGGDISQFVPSEIVNLLNQRH